MSSSPSDQKHWEQEQTILNAARAAHPDQFLPVEKIPGALAYRVGMAASSSERPVGYIKYSPLDFIVEEIRPNGEVMTVDNGTAQPEYPDGEGTVYVDLVKVGISTLDAVERLAKALSVEMKRIGYAGIKDAVALTSQRVSIREVALSAVQSCQIPNVVLRNVIERKGAIGVGNLQGNRFTLFIRTRETLDDRSFAKHIEQMAEQGIMNYYGVQRFGSPRFLAHVFGMFLLRGDWEGCVRAYFSKESEFEVPFFINKRRQAGQAFGDWQKIKDIFSNLPYSFRFELAMIDHLIEHPTDYLGAVHVIGQQAAMWLRAYASYLANLLMANAEKSGGVVPSELPLLLGQDPNVEKLYGTWLKAHGVDGYRTVIRELKFVQVGKTPSIEPVLKPVFHGHKIMPEGVALSFDLRKGAYATTVLEALFDVTTGYPVPEWVQKAEIDTKHVLDTGDLSMVMVEFAEAIANVMSKKQVAEE